jgi:Dyp-type peroxidase family
MSELASKPAQTAVEGLLAVNEIQGNIFAGFNKDHQRFLFLQINDRETVKTWLKAIAPRIATTAEVLAFNRLYRNLRERRGRDPQGMAATWINIAFTFDGIGKLTSPQEAARFKRLDLPFTLGLHQRSTLLGDPAAADKEGHASRWVVGGDKNLADILLIVAGDAPDLLAQKVAALLADLAALPVAPNGRPALELLFDQAGEARTDLPGHEHFGFKDGISQPGIRGRASRMARDFLTPRLISPDDPRAQQFGKPGQPLVWPGQFVVGYPTQDGSQPSLPAKPLRPSPAWTRNGSFLVVRRLKQNVAGFWQFLVAESGRLSQKPGFSGMTPERLGALLVGRWPSGAPVMRSPQSDLPKLGKDNYASNHFGYNTDSTPVSLTDADYCGDTYPQARSDSPGAVCPHIAHIRKVNPRDLGTDTGGTNDTLTRLILRRGIPFGTAMREPTNPRPAELAAERGLMFLCYQSSIERQFEFLMNHWTNSLNQPQQGGHDPLIGQRDGPLGDRTRQIELLGADGSVETLNLPIDWVVPTGGGYFFAPSLSALTNVLAQ